MKTLELTVYPKSRGMFGAQYDLPGGRHMLAREGADVMSRNKRLTDAELATEVFRQAAWIGANGRTHRTDAGRNIVFDAAFTFGPMTRDEHEWATMNSFAKLPHYDQEETTV